VRSKLHEKESEKDDLLKKIHEEQEQQKMMALDSSSFLRKV
jgi:hypothetical protein